MREQISRLQLFYLITWVVLATGYLTLPFVIAQFTIQDGWLVPFPFVVGVWLIFSLSITFTRHFPQQTMTEGLKHALGSFIGSIFSSALFLWLFILTCTVTRELVTFVDVTILPHTPIL